MLEDLKKREAEEREKARSLVLRAQIKSNAIRARLADVARDLRVAAASADAGSEHLLSLANRFERQSRAGDSL